MATHAATGAQYQWHKNTFIPWHVLWRRRIYTTLCLRRLPRGQSARAIYHSVYMYTSACVYVRARRCQSYTASDGRTPFVAKAAAAVTELTSRRKLNQSGNGGCLHACHRAWQRQAATILQRIVIAICIFEPLLLYSFVVTYHHSHTLNWCSFLYFSSICCENWKLLQNWCSRIQ